MQFGKSTTPVVRLMTFQSVEIVSGQKPCAHDLLDRVPANVVPHAVADVEHDAAAARREHLGQEPAVVVDDCVRRRREQVRHDVAGLEQRQQLAQRRRALAHVDHDGQAERLDRLLRALQDFDVVRADDGLGQPRLDADDIVAVALDGGACCADVRECKVLRVAVRQNSAAADVDEHAPRLRRGSRHRDGGLDAVRAGRARVDPARDAVAQQQSRAFRTVAAACVWMSIKPGTTSLPRASSVAAASAESVGSTAAIRPAAMPTSRTASSRSDGSMTRPPLMMRS